MWYIACFQHAVHIKEIVFTLLYCLFDNIQQNLHFQDSIQQTGTKMTYELSPYIRSYLATNFFLSLSHAHTNTQASWQQGHGTVRCYSHMLTLYAYAVAWVKERRP